MIEVRQTEEFTKWIGKLRDSTARAKIATRIRRIELQGNFGDVAPVGEGVSELRIHYGPGYRVYFVQDGDQIVILALRWRQGFARPRHCKRQGDGGGALIWRLKRRNSIFRII